MSDTIPTQQSIPNYRIGVPIDGTLFLFDFRWNARDAAWYFDMYEADETPIVVGVKIVLGTYLGRRCTHPFFASNVLVARDTSGQGLDAGFDDLGARVVLLRFTDEEVLAGRGFAT